MKKICAIGLVCVMLLTMSGCSGHILTTKCKTTSTVHSDEFGYGTYTKVITTDDFTGETVSVEEVYEFNNES